MFDRFSKDFWSIDVQKSTAQQSYADRLAACVCEPHRYRYQDWDRDWDRDRDRHRDRDREIDTASSKGPPEGAGGVCVCCFFSFCFQRNFILIENLCPPVHDTWFSVDRRERPSAHLYMTLGIPFWAKNPCPPVHDTWFFDLPIGQTQCPPIHDTEFIPSLSKKTCALLCMTLGFFVKQLS